MVGELADHHEGDQAGAGDAPRHGLGGDRRAGHAVAAARAGVLGQDVDADLELGRDELELAGEVLADPMLHAAAAGAGLLGLGQVVLDADVREVIQRVPAAGARLLGLRLTRRGFRLGGGGDDGLDRGVEQVEEMPLARVVDESLAAGAEDIAAEQRQFLGQLGVPGLQLAVIDGGLVEHAAELIVESPGVLGLFPGVLGLLPGVLGLPPQLLVAADQVEEQRPAFLGILGEG